MSSLHGDHNSVKGEDSHGSEIKRGMVQLRLEDVLVVAGYKIEQLSGLPREALEVLYKAVMLGIQKPKNPSICTERPDGLDETDSSPSIHADNTSPTPDLNPHNQSLEYVFVLFTSNHSPVSFVHFLSLTFLSTTYMLNLL